ncbi:hypothetical protein N0V88_006747 [Collariella sp. IMI 366227]|nr:hypothetical protein N0V88_006747 [Collariella sp. IMI 366227]
MRFIPAILGLIAISPALAAQDCQSIGLAVRDISSIGAVATEFCGSFLGIPATVTSVVTETPTQFVTVALPATTVTAGNCPNKTAKKRDIAAIPTGLDKYSDNVLSSACSRLSLKPTVTTTITGIASIAVKTFCA